MRKINQRDSKGNLVVINDKKDQKVSDDESLASGFSYLRDQGLYNKSKRASQDGPLNPDDLLIPPSSLADHPTKR